MEQNLGTVTIAPNVLVTIVQKTADADPDVARLSDSVPGVARLLGLPSADRGVAVNVVDDKVLVDVFMVARRDADLLQAGRRLQQSIARHIEHIVGMTVQEVNIHIEDVATELDPSKSTKKG